MLQAPGWRRWLSALLNPEITPELAKVLASRAQSVPVIWFLGKTGAGKSSIIQALTGDTRAQIGNGFAPCTATANAYDHPSAAPVMRFLDTRGLGESNYDPAQDLQQCQQASHVLIIVTRVDDPSQATLLNALSKLSKRITSTPVLQVHTALHSVDEVELSGAMAHNQLQIETALGFNIAQVAVDFTKPEDGFVNSNIGQAELQAELIELIPALAKTLSSSTVGDGESALFSIHRNQIIGYASAAAASDVVPAVGLVAVPSVQGKMLHTLAGRYGLDWDKQLISEFVAALGSGFLYRYAISLLGRQAAKFIPVYGQSVAAATAASISFASTYALGRAACLYFYKRSTHQTVDPDALRSAFEEAFKEENKRDNGKSP